MEISITLIIIIVTCIVSFSAFSNQKIIDDLIFYPPAIKRGQWYRFFSCGLIHADIGHLLFNMVALYLFGAGQHKNGVEYQFIAIFGEKGKWIFLLMYVLALLASLIPTYFKTKDSYHYRSLGASGAVSAVVFAMILLQPLSMLGLFIIPIKFAGFLFGIIYLFVSHWLDRKGTDNINHSAHIFGAIFGIGFTIIACQYFSEYPVLDAFVYQIKNMDPSQLIRFGS
ncbi:MAG TPA: rhomboid family intramembrane serine protease [Chitinophagaceae bacterium]